LYSGQPLRLGETGRCLVSLNDSITFAALSPYVFAQAVDIPFEKLRLENGLTVIVHEDRKAPVVATNVWYQVGSKNEVAGKTGSPIYSNI
jgi:predicted Zn-dependent peptidase